MWSATLKKNEIYCKYGLKSASDNILPNVSGIKTIDFSCSFMPDAILSYCVVHRVTNEAVFLT